MSIWKKIRNIILIPVDAIVAVAVLYDERRRQNLDGSWDKYWARKNARAMKKEERKKKHERYSN